MASDWKSIIDGLEGDITDEAKSSAKNFIDGLLSEGNDFTRRQGQKITAYLGEYERGELTAGDLKECMNDIVLLTESEAAKKSVEAKQKLQALALNVSKIVLKAVIAAII